MSNRVPTSMYSPRPKTSKRPHQEAQWSFGWDKQTKTQNSSVLKDNQSFMRYHNESHVVLQDKYTPDYENKKVQMRKNKNEEFNSKMPTFNPKTAGQSHIVFGSQKADFRPQSSGITSPRMPPGGKSNIIFG